MRRSRKPASLAVARNCGIGSSSLNADVKALDRLHSVRRWNSWCCGLKYRSWTGLRQVLRHLQLGFDERPVDDQLCRDVGELRLPPQFDLLAHAVEIPLHLVHADRQRVLQREVLGVLGEHRLKVAGERHILADEHPVAYGHGQAHGFVVGVPDADGKPATVHAGVEVEHAEHLHAVFGDGVFLLDHADVPEAEGFDQGFDDFVVRNWPVGCGTGRCGYGHSCSRLNLSP